MAKPSDVLKDTKEFADLLDEATKRLGAPWDLVADFSAYNGGDMRAALSGLRGRFGRYAYISSDSVYEVSAWAGEGWLPHSGSDADPHVAEAASERPGDKASRQRLSRKDSYGDGKLEAEEALAEGLAASPGCHGVSLRLPDVIGPFDDTGRLWAYWHWLHAGPKDPPQVADARVVKRPRRAPGGEASGAGGGEAPDKEDPVPLSFVFSRDVARFIGGLLDVPTGPAAPVHDSVNLACERQLELREFLGLLAAASGLETPPKVVVTSRPKTFLPSVDRPWKLSLERLQKDYNFVPTPLPEVLGCCADWFKRACTEFPREAKRAAGKLPPKPRKVALEQAGLTKVPSSSSSSDSSAGSSDS